MCTCGRSIGRASPFPRKHLRLVAMSQHFIADNRDRRREHEDDRAYRHVDTSKCRLAADEVDLSGVSTGPSVASGPSAPYLPVTPCLPGRSSGPRTAPASGSTPSLRLQACAQRSWWRRPAPQPSAALAIEGVGVGIVNPASADGFPERGLVFRPFEPAVYFKSILLFRPDSQQARLVREFVAALLQARDKRHSLQERYESRDPLGDASKN